MVKKKLIIINVYLGQEFPWYFSFFLKSCAYNPDIDFLILSDIDTAGLQLPANVRIENININYINNLASKKLDLTINITNSYKLCDFKPLYGLLFEDMIEAYSYWGYCDIDIIFGNIQEFITDKVLYEHHIMSVRSEYLSGFFAVYRNEINIKKLFNKSKDYRKVLFAKQYLGFDECSLLCDELLDGKKIEELECGCESMTHVITRLTNEGEIKSYFDLHVIESVPGNLIWENGKLYYNSSYEVMLYHLVSFKVHPHLMVPKWTEIPNKFFINEFSFTKF